MNSKTRRNRELKSMLFICQIHIYISGGKTHPSSTWYRWGRQRSTRVLELQGEKRKQAILNGFVHSEVRRRAVCRLCFPSTPPTPTHKKCVGKGGSANVGGGLAFIKMSDKPLPYPATAPVSTQRAPCDKEGDGSSSSNKPSLFKLIQIWWFQSCVTSLCDVWRLDGCRSDGWAEGGGGNISQEEFAPFSTLCPFWVFLFFVCLSWG